MINWNPRPEAIQMGPLVVRWYGMLFSVAFLSGYQIQKRLFRMDGVSIEPVDSLLGYVAAGTIIGARLGHCLFYEPEIYLRDPIRILKIWEGGLASHGAAIGIVVALWLFRRKWPEFGLVWLLDRCSIGVAFAAGLIRIGNLFNSEIIGRPTQLPWAFTFQRIDSIPRHPTQIYESICYFGISFILYQIFKRKPNRRKIGLVFGVYLLTVFTVRFCVEFIKENQVSFESGLPLNMGQLLSIPLILIGIWLIYRALTSPMQLEVEGTTLAHGRKK